MNQEAEVDRSATPDATMDIPKGLSRTGRRAAQAIRKLAVENHLCFTGGCVAFRNPKTWANGQHWVGDATGAVLIVIYDGGDLGNLFGETEATDWELAEFAKAVGGSLPAGERHEEKLIRALKDVGCYYERANSWSAIIYPE